MRRYPEQVVCALIRDVKGLVPPERMPKVSRQLSNDSWVVATTARIIVACVVLKTGFPRPGIDEVHVIPRPFGPARRVRSADVGQQRVLHAADLEIIVHI